jgi:CMP-N-acetylneuraminic acid synthetase
VAKRPNIVIKNKKEKICILLDATTPVEGNVTKKETEKKLIQEFMYRDTTNVKLEMYGCTSTRWSQWNSKRILKKNLEDIPGKHSIYVLYKTAILSTPHITRKLLQSET